MSKEMKDVNSDNIEISNFIKSTTSHIEAAIKEISYRDMSDKDSLTRDALLYKDAISKLSLDDCETYQSVVNIQFSKVNDLIASELAANPKAFRSIDDRKLFLETYLVPAIIERYFVLGNSLYLKSKFGAWTKIGIASDLQIIIKIACSMLPSLNVTSGSNVLTAVNDAIALVMDNRRQSTSGDIQFRDCTFKPNVGLVDEPPTSFPRYMFTFDVFDDYMNGVDPVKAVDDLLLHIADGDEDTKRCLVDRLSMMFIADRNKKIELDAKIIMLYGPGGGNGKSTLAELLKNALNHENCKAFSIGSFKGYALADIESNILMVDSEASSLHIDSLISTAIKQVVTADEMQVRQIYKSPKTVRPLAQLVVCTNAAPKAEDKSRGWDRRLEWYEVSKPLMMPAEDYKRLHTEAAWRYFRVMLLKNAMKLVAQKGPIEPSKKIMKANDRYANLNKNVLMWLAEAVADAGLPTSRDFIIDKPSAMVRALYEEWCEESHETALGITNFNSIVELETGLVRKTAFCSMTNRREAFEWWKSQGDVTKKLNETSKRIACWIDDRD